MYVVFSALREAGGGGGGRVYHQYNMCMLCLQHLERQEEAAGGVCITNITFVCCVCST